MSPILDQTTSANGVSVTASGLVVVRGSSTNSQSALADLDSQLGRLPGAQGFGQLAGGILPQIPLAANEWRLPYKQGNAQTTMVSGQMVLEPIWLPGGTLDGLAALFATVSTNGNFRLLAFNASSNGHPNVCIANTASTVVPSNAISGATGLATVLNPALYWLGYLWVGTTGPTISQGPTAGNPSIPWAAMPHGTASLPSVSTGNDGTCASWTGQIIAGPGGTGFVGVTFGGTLANNSNTPLIPPAIWLRYSAVS